MMRRLALALAVAAVLAAGGAQASGVNVALAGALGAYDADPLALNLRTATIDLTGVGRDATGLALSWAGYATPGLLALCDEPEQTSDWPGVLQVRIDHPDGGVWEGLAEMLTGEVGEITFLEFYGSGAPDLDFLFAGPVDVHVGFWGQTYIGILCPVDYPLLDLGSAVLIVEGVVTTEARTWGAVKRLYH